MSDMHPLISTYTAHLRHQRRSEKTIKTYRDTLGKADRELPVGLPRATEDELIAWLGREGWSDNTQKTYTAILRSFFQWAVRWEKITYDPTTRIDAPKLERRLPRPPSLDQLRIILTHARQPVRLWSTIATYTGARAIEISRLHREHITPEWTRLHGKGGVERRVPTHPALWATVRDLPAGPLTTCTAKRISTKSAEEFRRLGIGTTLHKLRAWFATTTLQATGDLAAVQDMLGHASPATTRVYATPAEEQFRRAVGAIPDLSADEDE